MQVMIKTNILKLVILAIVCYALWYGAITLNNNLDRIIWNLSTPIYKLIGGKE